jgi:hypothetical protein
LQTKWMECMFTRRNGNVMAMVTFVTKPTRPYCYRTFAIKCRLWNGVQDGLWPKINTTHISHISNCFCTTLSSTSTNLNSLFASLMMPCNLKDSTLDSSKVSSSRIAYFFCCSKTILAMASSPYIDSSLLTNNYNFFQLWSPIDSFT